MPTRLRCVSICILALRACAKTFLHQRTGCAFCICSSRIVSLSNVIASTCQYEALKHVSFVVQLPGGTGMARVYEVLRAPWLRMLGKSFKTIPVMIWEVVVSGKRRLVDAS